MILVYFKYTESSLLVGNNLMAKRQTGLSPTKRTKHPHKTKKRLAAKKLMIAAKAGKKGRKKLK